MARKPNKGRTIRPATAPNAAPPTSPSPDAATAEAAAAAASGDNAGTDPNATAPAVEGAAGAEPAMTTEGADNRNAENAAATAGGDNAGTDQNATAPAVEAAAGDEAAEEEAQDESPEAVAARREASAAAFREAALKGESPAAALGVNDSATVSAEAGVLRSAPTGPGSPAPAVVERAADAAAAADALRTDEDLEDGGLDESGHRVIVAFTDATTGARVAPGDPLPAHITEDGPRLGRLYDGGFITDKPAERRSRRRVEGGLKTVTRDTPNGAAQPLGDRRPREAGPAS